jgi:hypothetical protein
MSANQNQSLIHRLYALQQLFFVNDGKKSVSVEKHLIVPSRMEALLSYRTGKVEWRRYSPIE